MRADGAAVFRYPSARDPQRGPNVGLFLPTAFRRRTPLDERTWYCHTTEDRVIFSRVMTARPIEFLRTDFLVDGKLPYPPNG